MKTNNIIAFIFLSIVLWGCTQSEPTGRFEDKIQFSGRTWTVKYGTNQMGPGPNYFSYSFDDVFVDTKDRLHLKIAEHDGKWYSTEVVCDDNTGYGKYIFTVIGDFVNMPENIVLGLFTWDDSTFYEQANSEIDIELSKWGDTAAVNPLTYSVQPVSFYITYPERTHIAETDSTDLIGVSTHVINWTPSLITWQSYTGYEVDENKLISEWSFDLNNPARVKFEGDEESEPVIIPAPGKTTNARINFWILTSVAAYPTDQLEHEVIIDSYEYIPAE